MGVQGLAGVTPGKPLPRPLTMRERGAAMGRGQRNGGKGGRQENMGSKTSGVRATSVDARPPEGPTSLPEWGTRRGDMKPP